MAKSLHLSITYTAKLLITLIKRLQKRKNKQEITGIERET